MTSLMTRSVVLFLCWEIVAQCSAKDLTISFLDFSAIVNGRFNNFEGEAETGQDKIDALVKPALAPGLQQDPVLYCEETLNGKVYRMWVATRNESSSDRVIYLDYYNFTDPSQYEPRTFNTDDLVNYKRDDFKKSKDCQATYERMSDGTIVGQVNDPRHVVNGHHPLYGQTISCDEVCFIVPILADEASTRVPYCLHHRGPRYPLIGAPEGYVNPCQGGR